jgi:chromosome segregation ATPase
MLYLAEVQRQKSGFMGGGKAELRLLACQRTEQNWTAIPGEELVSAPEEANTYPAGMLVLIEMNAHRQVQGQVRDAGKHLVGILQTLSRQIEKYKKEADEIETWRQSLSLQSQQLQLRQEEIYSREEELEIVRGEVDRLREEAGQHEEVLKATEKQRQELALAWERLREQQQAVDPFAAGDSGVSLPMDRLVEVRDALGRLGSLTPVQKPDIDRALDILADREATIERHLMLWQERQQSATEKQAQLARAEVELNQKEAALQELQSNLHRAQTEWEVQSRALTLQQERTDWIAAQLELTDRHYQQFLALSRGTNADLDIGKIDIEKLEQMSLDELQSTAGELKTETERAESFVRMQEEELSEQQAAIDEIEEKIAAANEFDRLQLENDLADERDAFAMLQQTLQGQQETIKERQSILSVYESILQRRQGSSDEGSPTEWETALSLLATQRDRLRSENDRLAESLSQIVAQVETSKRQIEADANGYLQQSANAKDDRERLAILRQETIAIEVEQNLYREAIVPLKASLQEVRAQLAALSERLDSLPDRGDAIASAERILAEVLDRSKAVEN